MGVFTMSNMYYYNIILENMNVFMSKNSRKQVLNAIKTLKNRTLKALNNKQIAEKDAAEVLEWLEKCRRWTA